MGKKQNDTNHIGQIGISWLQWIIEGKWACGIEVISSHNDNSLDVLIFLKRRVKSAYAGPTGDVIFAQVKTGYVHHDPTPSRLTLAIAPATVATTYKINLGKKYVDMHKPRWLAFPGPVIMISVIPPSITCGEPKAFWTDLREPTSFDSSGGVVFDISHKVDEPSGKASFFNLCWRWAHLRSLPVIESPQQVPWSPKHHPGLLFAVMAESLHRRSKNFYKDWMARANAVPADFGDVKITNRGWRHMTRVGRSKSRMLQSLLLLPAASKMLEPSSGLVSKRLTPAVTTQLPSGRRRVRWYEGLTARVTFFERQETVVRVVLEHTVTYKNADNTQSEEDIRSLYSIYEVARRRKMV